MIEIAVFTLLLLTGYALRVFIEVVMRKQEFCGKTTDLLTRIVYYILIPLAFFTTFARRGLLYLDIYIALYFALFTLVIYGITYRFYSGSERYVFFLLSAFPNSVFLGFPVCYALFGNVDIAAVFGTLTIALGIAIPDALVGRRTLVKALLSSTAILGFTLGVIAHYVFKPLAVKAHSLLWWSAPLLSYVATFTMGLSIPVKFNEFSKYARFLVAVGIVRFVIAPLLTVPVSTLVGFSRESALQLAVVSMMPPAVMNVLVARKYNWSPQLTAVGTVLLTVFFLAVVFPTLVLAIIA